MDKASYWQNFNLGIEIHVAGDFIYNGLKAFHELDVLDRAHEVFEVMYPLAVGLERLMKVAVVLIEHKDGIDQELLEKSLITHNHQKLLHRISKVREIRLGPVHNEFLQMLVSFYKSYRYDRFNISSIGDMEKEKVLLRKFFEKHLKAEMSKHSFFSTNNDIKFRKFLEKTVFKIARQVYNIIKSEAQSKGIFTWELECDSKAGFIFMGERTLASLDNVWKEALIYLMNTSDEHGMLKHVRSFSPLVMDGGICEYFGALGTDKGRRMVADEVESRYEDIPKCHERIAELEVIGEEGIIWDEHCDDEE